MGSCQRVACSGTVVTSNPTGSPSVPPEIGSRINLNPPCLSSLASWLGRKNCTSGEGGLSCSWVVCTFFSYSTSAATLAINFSFSSYCSCDKSSLVLHSGESTSICRSTCFCFTLRSSSLEKVADFVGREEGWPSSGSEGSEFSKLSVKPKDWLPLRSFDELLLFVLEINFLQIPQQSPANQFQEPYCMLVKNQLKTDVINWNLLRHSKAN